MNETKRVERRVEKGRSWKKAAELQKGVAQVLSFLVRRAEDASETYRRDRDLLWQDKRRQSMITARLLLESTTEPKPVGRPLFTLFKPKGRSYERFPRHEVTCSDHHDWRYVRTFDRYSRNNPYEDMEREWAA